MNQPHQNMKRQSKFRISEGRKKINITVAFFLHMEINDEEQKSSK